MSGILDGMRVVESSAFVAVPLAGMTLAQMGADVIRFDLPQGGMDYKRWPVTTSGESLFWAGMNKGKRSVALDVKCPRGREIAQEIICAPGEDAGLFITNLAAKGWTDYETLKARREDLCMVSLRGDRHGKPAVDYTVNPSLGFPMATGPEGSSDPVAHVLPAWDCIAGNMVVSGLLAAERARLRKGLGQFVDLTLKDAAAAMLGNLGIIGEVAVNGTDRAKAGNSLYGAYGQDFVCADGRRVMVIALTPRQWKNLMKVTGTEQDMGYLAARLGVDLMQEGVRWTYRAEITKVLAPWFSRRKVSEFSSDFDKGGVTWSQFRSFAQALREDPDLSTENPMFSEIEQPGIGRYRVPGSPFSFAGIAREAPRPAPQLGQHTEEVLADVAKLPEGEIGKLMDEGVAVQPRGDFRLAS
ncbi:MULTISPECIES: CoA transferase [Mameliella]|uniref:Putative dehydratase/racemase n=1 Tax=Mameliella alba TaxID=561184 RepID=A0A0B3RV58_9RHOB|nr:MULTISPECIES: CoA transferase [Mameliella]MCR9275990.1 CoA transferase [Paracoccaceae bacterium]ODM47288.1 mesaconyl-CoA isomerase [Ruegeria sp. PBVC088]KHQ50638.1 putative dehydratase/racemase [Mameliella alba]MDD9732548.1 CoA transferase [Mameliella sp. AT18]OWV53252.1 2-methylfumaryl-CoA isomerase [Mameliella alba]